MATKSTDVQNDVKRFNELLNVVRKNYKEKNGKRPSDVIVAELAGIPQSTLSLLKRPDKAMPVIHKMDKVVKMLCSTEYAAEVNELYVLSGKGKLINKKTKEVKKPEVMVIDEDEEDDIMPVVLELDDDEFDAPEEVVEETPAAAEQEDTSCNDELHKQIEEAKKAENAEREAKMPAVPAPEPEPEQPAEESVEVPEESKTAPAADAAGNSIFTLPDEVRKEARGIALSIVDTFDDFFSQALITEATEKDYQPVTAYDQWLDAAMKLGIQSEDNMVIMKDARMHIFKKPEGKLPYRQEIYDIQATGLKQTGTVNYYDEKKKYKVVATVSYGVIAEIEADSVDDAESKIDALIPGNISAGKFTLGRIKSVTQVVKSIKD